jgi:hypothetical protein
MRVTVRALAARVGQAAPRATTCDNCGAVRTARCTRCDARTCVECDRCVRCRAALCLPCSGAALYPHPCERQEGSIMTLLTWLHVIALVGALVMFALAAGNIPARPNLIALGLAFLTAAFILGGAGTPLPPMRP